MCQIAFLKFTSCDNLGFSWVYSNYCCNCSFESEIMKIGQSSHKMYSNNILNLYESTTIIYACTKMSGNLLNSPRNVIGISNSFVCSGCDARSVSRRFELFCVQNFPSRPVAISRLKIIVCPTNYSSLKRGK